MTEGMNVEIAHKLSEHEHSSAHRDRVHEVFEIFEVAMLAIVAVATAWSGFQAAKWDGHQSVLYGEASRDRFEADAASTLGGQKLVADSALLNGWLQAHAANDTELQDIYVRRFTPEYRVAFDAWLATNPFTDPKAPPGPGYMPQYHNPDFAKAESLNAKASAEFDEGTHSRETAEKYVQATVLFASVLFLVALAQRAKSRGPRIGMNVIALVVLVYTIISVSGLSRA